MELKIRTSFLHNQSGVRHFGMSKRGIFFSMDALIAVAIILIVILVAVPNINQNRINSKIDEDILVSLSSISAEDFDNSYVQSLISSGIITEPNKSLLEQIGNFYVTNITIATRIADEFLSGVKTKDNVGIWLENNLVSSKNATSLEEARQVEASRQIISGVMLGENITGYSARAFLSSNVKTSYNYFGGYVGDGNITLTANYNGTITSADLEAATNKDFQLYINDVYAGNYTKSPSTTNPSSYSLSNHLTKFNSGINHIKFVGNGLYIAGGFLKLTYRSEPQYFQPIKYYFPGIEGLINIYDGFYVPGNLTEIEARLHVNSNLSFFMAIGNTSVYRGATSGEQIINLDNSYLSQELNYNDISKKTVPIRLGLENATFEVNVSLDIITVNDITQSMGSYNEQLRNANLMILNNTVLLFPNILRLGIVTYRAASTTVLFHALSNNYNSLFNEVANFLSISYSSQQRSLCNGIQRAVQEFNISSQQEKIRISILMGAGALSDQQCLASGSDVYEKTKNAACDAHNQSGIIFYTVGFGTNNNTIATLQQIAGCSQGAFFLGELENLSQVYQTVVNEILTNYQLQTVYSTNESISTKLYPDSYIKFTYQQPVTQYGIPITIEKPFSNSTSVNFDIPSGSTPISVDAISYSGGKWTNRVTLNNETVYNLTTYGTNYLNLGDPYAISIDPNKLLTNNTLSLAISNSGGINETGSNNNKVIYTVLKNMSAYSPISATREGCTWLVHFEDNSNTTVSIPQNYTGVNSCTYSPSSIIYNTNDALQAAVYNLFRQLDLDLDGRIDFIFNQNEVTIDTTEIQGIPFPWSTEIQVRRWI